MGAYQSTHTGQEIDTCLDTYLSSSTLPAALAAAKTEIINAIYPVGSIYININNTNPNTLFGGLGFRLRILFFWLVGRHTPLETPVVKPNIRQQKMKFLRTHMHEEP